MQIRNYSMAIAALSLSLLLLGPASILASEPIQDQGQRIPTIRVSGTAVVYAKPDYASIEMGVTKLALRVSDAKAECDQTMQKVQAALRKAGISQDDIQTTNYQIFPVQEKPTLPRKWKVAHQVTVKVRKVGSVADVLDAVATNGATSISGVDYGIEKVLELRSKARAEAMRVAREKAAELAKLAGRQLVEVLTITDSSYEGGAAQYYQNSSMDNSFIPSRGGGTLSGGRIAVTVRVDVEYSMR
jgi:uncharacterized protein YggE